MKIKKIILIFILIFALNLSAFASKNKIHLFPVFALESNIELSQEYTSQLKKNLIKTEIFDISLLEDFNSVLNSEDDVFITTKNIVKEVCKENNINSAIFGYLTKSRYGYKLKMILYSVYDDNIVSEFYDNIYDIGSIPRSAKRCAVEFAARLNSIKGSKVFFSSLMMPGLGQFMLGKYIRGTIFVGMFSYFAADLLSTDDIKIIEDKRFQKFPTGTGYIYYVNNREVSFEEYIRTKENYEYTKEKNEELKDKKKKLQIYVGVVYLLNVIDALRLINNLNDKRIIEQKLSVDFNPLYSKSLIKLNYRF